MEPILEMRNLCKTFRRRDRGAVEAVRDVSLQLFPGEVLGIVGESGSGKSTLARMACGLLPPSSGSLLVEGAEVHCARRKERKRLYETVQMVFQSPLASFDPRRTIGYTVGEGLRNRGQTAGEAAAQTQALLTQCGLPEELARRYPRQLSGGQCQRAAIARALALQPKVLICDEATSALDVVVQGEILELLRQMQRTRGLACLFICHNLALVQSFCHRVAVMREGMLVEEGTPESVILHPQNEYTRHLIEAVL